MSDPQSANPFAAPRTTIEEPEIPLEDDPALLRAAEAELARTTFWIWCVALFVILIAVHFLVSGLLLLVKFRNPAGALQPLLSLVLFVVLSMLLIRWTGKIQEFRRAISAANLQEVFAGHAQVWILAGVTALLLLGLTFLRVLFFLMRST